MARRITPWKLTDTRILDACSHARRGKLLWAVYSESVPSFPPLSRGATSTGETAGNWGTKKEVYAESNR
jgi:hypothetical protein